MSKVSIQVRIDEDLKKEATELFNSLGLDLSTAVNIFLHQCILYDGLPFKIEQPKYSKDYEKALEELRKARKETADIEQEYLNKKR